MQFHTVFTATKLCDVILCLDDGQTEAEGVPSQGGHESTTHMKVQISHHKQMISGHGHDMSL